MTANRTSQTARKRPIVIDQDGREVGSNPFDNGFGTTSGAFGGASFEDVRIHWGAGSSAPLTREQRVARLEAIAQLLDVAFIVPGTKIRYGLDGLIGLIPIVGDVLTTAISLWMVREARAIGAPRHLIARMLANVAVDGVIGIVPLAGDAFDVMWRANVRNMRMLRKWIDKHPVRD